MESAPTVGIGLKALCVANVDIDKSLKDVCANTEQTILSQLALTAPLPKEPNIVKALCAADFIRTWLPAGRMKYTCSRKYISVYFE